MESRHRGICSHLLAGDLSVIPCGQPHRRFPGTPVPTGRASILASTLRGRRSQRAPSKIYPSPFALTDEGVSPAARPPACLRPPDGSSLAMKEIAITGRTDCVQR